MGIGDFSGEAELIGSEGKTPRGSAQPARHSPPPSPSPRKAKALSTEMTPEGAPSCYAGEPASKDHKGVPIHDPNDKLCQNCAYFASCGATWAKLAARK